MSTRIVYFMRGLYSTGKSTRAKELAGDTGIVLEVDKFFEVQTDDGIKYEYRQTDLHKARRHVHRELKRALRSGITPIVIDRDNQPSLYTRKLMRRALESGYTPKLAEPKSELWNIFRVMLKNKKKVDVKSLEEFAQKLFALSQKKHGVSFEIIFQRVMHWPGELTINDYLNYRESVSNKQKSQVTVYFDSD